MGAEMKPSDIKLLKVGAHIYKVIKPYLFRDTDDLNAQVDHSLCEVRIKCVDCSGNPRESSTIEESFWHEAIHVIDKVYNASRLDEDTTRRLAEGLTQVLNDSFDIKPKVQK